MPRKTKKRCSSPPWKPGGSAAQSLPHPRHDRDILCKRILLTQMTRVPSINSLPKVWPKLGAGQGAIHQSLTGEKGVRGKVLKPIVVPTWWLASL